MTSLSPSLSLIEKSFNKELTSNYHLSFIVGLSEFSYCILDIKQNRLMALEEIRFQKQPNYESLCELLRSYISESPILSAKQITGFKGVSVGIYTEIATLIPSALFDENRKKKILQFNFSRETIFPASDFLVNLDAYIIYDAPEMIGKTFKEIYGKSKIVHFSSSLLESILMENKFKIGTKIYLHFFLKNNYGTASRFEITILKEGKLLFFNSFIFQEKEDIAYYLLFVMEQLHINPENTPVSILGDIHKTDEAVDLIGNYVKTVEFGNRPGNYNYSSVFEDIPSHFHHALLSQYLFI